jgi:hypothetical protein
MRHTFPYKEVERDTAADQIASGSGFEQPLAGWLSVEGFFNSPLSVLIP